MISFLELKTGARCLQKEQKKENASQWGDVSRLGALSEAP